MVEEASEELARNILAPMKTNIVLLCLLEVFPGVIDSFEEPLALPLDDLVTVKQKAHVAAVADRSVHVAFFAVEHAWLVLPGTALLAVEVLLPLPRTLARPVAMEHR